MKIRTDFVTNSSSSSFIAVFGVETNKELAESSRKIFEDNIFIGKHLKEHWDELKREFTSDWFCVDPWCGFEEIEDDKLYFAYWSNEELTESEDYSQWNGYDESEIEGHMNNVRNELEELAGFRLDWDTWQGRDG